MKLHEVRKPGQMFKRPDHDWMFLVNGVTKYRMSPNDLITYEYLDEDLDADDWLVKEETVMITRAALQEAYNVVFSAWPTRCYVDEIFDALKGIKNDF